jgi:RHS repeat-associated protein
VQSPDGASTTAYAYAGNTVTVTDAAGKWKKMTMDAFGNITKVTEPNPAGGTWDTNYTFDFLNRLTQVSQTRSGTTQNRTWTYTGAYLTQTSFPETGTTSFTYNSNSTLAYTIDAKNQKIAYTYDSLGRVIQTDFYSVSTNFTPDANSSVYITYDAISGGVNQTGRVAQTSYYAGTRYITERYNYTAPGQVTSKKFILGTQTMEATWTYDNEGRMSSVTYPVSATTYNFTYDSMSRLNGMTQGANTLVNNITYGPAGELLTMSYLGYNETRQYNNRLQMTRLTTSNGVNTQTDFEYRFPTAGSNNGQLYQMKDWVTGEEVTYAYDALQRLASATTTGPEWGQAYGYDGFGNLLSQTVTKGTAPYMSVSVNPANNRVTGTSYDNNGNDLTFGSYDVSNRLKQAGSMQYGYDPGNKRVWKNPGTGVANEEFTFWAGNQRLGTYKSTNPGTAAFTVASTNLYFGGRLIQANGTAILIDRLGSNVMGGKRYFPYGQEKPSATTNNVEKFTGYFRDSETGLDYADQRFHNPGTGRFTTPDPLGSGLNYYAYVDGDPANKIDPRGLLTIVIGGTGNSNNPDWATSGLSYQEMYNMFQEFPILLPWDSDLLCTMSGSCIGAAGKKLADFMKPYLANLQPGETINIVAHSHGGNVVKSYTNEANAVPIDNFVALGTPQRDDFKVKPGMVKNYYNVYSENDRVQILGGPIAAVAISASISIIFNRSVSSTINIPGAPPGVNTGLQIASTSAFVYVLVQIFPGLAGRCDPFARNINVSTVPGFGTVDHPDLHGPEVLNYVFGQIRNNPNVGGGC